MSIGKLDDNGNKIIFASQSFCITKGNMVIAKGNEIGSLYPLFIHQKEHLLVLTDQPMMSICHGHLGHMSQNGIKIISLHRHLPKLSFSNFVFCEHCQYGKQTKNAHKTQVNSSIDHWVSFTLMLVDLCPQELWVVHFILSLSFMMPHLRKFGFI